MSESAKLKVAQIGVANYGAARRNAMRATGLFDLLACYDWNEDAMAQAEKQDGAKPCDSYEDMLATPGLEAVIVSTGAKYHAEQVLAALERGLHVFVEKPLCSSSDEMHALLDAQQKTGLVVGVGHTDHHGDAPSITIKDQIDRGHLGDLTAFEATTCHNGGLQIKPGDWRGDPKKNPGGMLFQCGVHKVHELMYYFGPVKAVGCHMRYDINTATGTADVAFCHLAFTNGLLGTLNAYHLSPYRHTLNIFGTKANLYMEHRFFDEGTTLLKQTTHYDGKKEPHDPLPFVTAGQAHGGLRSFYAAIREGKPLYPSLADGARAVAVIFAAEASAGQGGEMVEIPPIA